MAIEILILDRLHQAILEGDPNREDLAWSLYSEYLRTESLGLRDINAVDAAKILIPDPSLLKSPGPMFRAKVRGEEKDLSRLDYLYLTFFKQNEGRPISLQEFKERFPEQVRGRGAFSRRLTSRIVLLRRLIEEDPHNPKLITTRPAIGYIYSDPENQVIIE